jgi:hypothetical protein
MKSVEASTNKGVLLTRCSIEFSSGIQQVPNAVLDEARMRFQELGDGLLVVPGASVFWESMRQSRLCLEFAGW